MVVGVGGGGDGLFSGEEMGLAKGTWGIGLSGGVLRRHMDS